MTDLGGTTAVVPVRDTATMELLDEGSRPAQAKAEQGVQAETKAILPICQDLRRLGLAG
jgi:hypothetical protein